MHLQKVHVYEHMSHTENRQIIIKNVLFLAFLFAVNVLLSQLLLATNVSIRTSELKIAELGKENQNLRVKLSRFESSEYITTQAKKLDFITDPPVVYIMQNEFAQK